MVDRNDWTPAVLITATICLITAGLVVAFDLWRGARDGGLGEDRPRSAMPATVHVWTGELAPGLKVVLGPVWGDTLPDRDHDLLLNGGLGLRGDSALSYFRLIVFNTADEMRTLQLRDGALLMKDKHGGKPIALRSLAQMLERDEIAIPEGLAFSLRSLGALHQSIEVPPGRYAKLLAPFPAGTRLESASAVVVTTSETALRPRQMARGAFRRLIADPDAISVEDL